MLVLFSTSRRSYSEIFGTICISWRAVETRTVPGPRALLCVVSIRIWQHTRRFGQRRKNSNGALLRAQVCEKCGGRAEVIDQSKPTSIEVAAKGPSLFGLCHLIRIDSLPPHSLAALFSPPARLSACTNKQPAASLSTRSLHPTTHFCGRRPGRRHGSNARIRQRVRRRSLPDQRLPR